MKLQESKKKKVNGKGGCIRSFSMEEIGKCYKKMNPGKKDVKKPEKKVPEYFFGIEKTQKKHGNGGKMKKNVLYHLLKSAIISCSYRQSGIK